MVSTTPKTEPTPDVEEFPTPPTDLPYDDEDTLESPQHRIAMQTLIRSCQFGLSQQRSDFYCGANMFVHFSETRARNRETKGPDFFVALGVPSVEEKKRLYWAIWDEEGRYPDVIVELLSSSTQAKDLGTKKDLYERTFKTPDYFVFDPLESDSLQGWSLDLRRGYQQLEPDERGWLWCETLGWWLGTWEGNIEQTPGVWLRFYDGEGNLVLLPEEAEQQRAEAEQQRAEAAEAEIDRLKALLQERGINPES